MIYTKKGDLISVRQKKTTGEWVPTVTEKQREQMKEWHSAKKKEMETLGEKVEMENKVRAEREELLLSFMTKVPQSWREVKGDNSRRHRISCTCATCQIKTAVGASLVIHS